MTFFSRHPDDSEVLEVTEELKGFSFSSIQLDDHEKIKLSFSFDGN